MPEKPQFDATREIRVGWRAGIKHEGGVYRNGGVWFVDTPEIRRALTTIVLAANAVHGASTHWIETTRPNLSGDLDS